ALVQLLHLGPELVRRVWKPQRAEEVDPPRALASQHGHGEVCLVIEVVVEGALAEPGREEDAVERRGLVAVLRELLRRDVEHRVSLLGRRPLEPRPRHAPPRRPFGPDFRCRPCGLYHAVYEVPALST